MIDPVKDDFPNGWAFTTLGEPLHWGSGGTPLSSRADYYGGAIPWAIIGDLNDETINETASFITEDGLRNSSAKWVEPDSVLLAMYGSIGKLGINSIPLTTNQAIAFTNPKPIVAKYLFYYLMHARADLISLGKGGTQRNISQSVIKSFRFLVAPLPEQPRIVEAIESYLTRLDDAMATLERVERNLKRYRASVLKAAVEGRLVPTEAELACAEGRGYEPASILLERILTERRRRWEEAELARMKAKGKVPKNDKWKAKYVDPAGPDTSKLPELPEGWCWTTISAVTVFGPQNGLYVPQSFYGGGVPILRIDDYQADCSCSSEELRQVDVSAQVASRYGLRISDIVVNRVNSPSHLGKSLAVAERHLPAVFESNMMRIGISEFVSPLFVQAYLSSDDGKDRLIANAKWAVNQASINQGDVGATPLPLPPESEQNRILAEVDRLLSSATGISAGSKLSVVRCVRLRQSILKWAFEGRLVDQDPSDEPAEVLLERIRAERTSAKGRKQPRTRRVNTRSASA